MNYANRSRLTGTVLVLAIVVAMVVVVTATNMTVHADSHPDLEVGTPSVDDASHSTLSPFTLSVTVTNAGSGESEATTLRY